MGCGLCKAKVPSSAGAVHFPKRQQRKNDLSPSSTWAASSSPAADTVVHGSDKNGSSSKIEASTLSPSVSQEVARFPVEDKNKDDMFKRVDQNHQGGTGIGSKAETTNEKQSNSTGFEGEEARQRCDKATSSAATIERKNRLRRKKLSTDAGSPTTGQSSFSAPGVKETLRRRLSVAEKEEWYKRLCNDSLEEGTQKEDLSGSKRQSSPCSVPADERKCSSCEYFLLTESCQDSAHSNTNPKTNATPERSGISIGETSNTCNEPLEEKTKADDSDNSRQTHIKRTSNVSKGGRAVVRDSQEDQERETEPGRHSTSLLPYFPVAQRNSFLSQLDKAQQQEADKLALCVTSEKMKNLELSCCSNKWREKFPSSKDIEHCIQEAYEACVHYNVDAAEEQLTKAEELYARMHTVCAGFTGKRDSSSSISVSSSPYAATSFSPRVIPVVRSGLERMPLPSYYDTKHLERKIENLRDTIQTLRQALLFYSGSRSLHTASLRNAQQQVQLQALQSPLLQTQRQRLAKRQQLARLPALRPVMNESVDEGSGKCREQSGVCHSRERTATRSGRNPTETSL